MDALLTTRRRLLLGALGAAALAACGRTREQTNLLHFAGDTMGTRYTAKIAGAFDEARAGALRAAVHAALDGVDRRMSVYRPDSELSAFNRARAGAPLPLSAELYTVLAAAQSVSRQSDGAFDVTVAPLVDAWGFGPPQREKARTVPPLARVQAQRPAVGYRALRLDEATRSATKLREGLRADLGGIAKGYGVDCAARALEANGVRDYMIEAGGEVRVRGRRADGAPWRIGIERPDAWPPRAHYVVPLAGGAMATSGDYRIYFEQDGRRYSHEIDPATGFPIEHRLCSVTVVADDCMRADALATALIVLGPERGWALAQAHGLAAYFIERDTGGGFTGRATAAFAALGGAHA
ncbi:MAG: FAD:protein FMN transferase [Burkholderiaceae bacterium]